MRRSVILLLAIFLAGCTSPADPVVHGPALTSEVTLDDAERPAHTPPASSSQSTQSHAESEPEKARPAAPRPDEPPVVNLSADRLQGPAPLEVTFAVNATDDGAFSWALDLDGDGMPEREGHGNSTTNVSLSHTFEAGTFNVTLTVADGNHTVSTALIVEAIRAASQTVRVTWTTGTSDAGAFREAFSCRPGETAGTTHGVFTVDPATYGLPFTATLAALAPPVGWALYFYEEGCGTSKSFGATMGGGIHGVVPSGTTLVVLYANGGAGFQADYTAA